jgi:type II secretory pathway pseudopilin PulG
VTRPVVRPRRASGGFTLVELIVVLFLFALAMLGILAVFDAGARIHKSELDVADAQGAARYGIHAMTRAIRMAGSGGLAVTQAIVNAADPDLPGIAPPGVAYDNVPEGTRVTSLNGDVPVRAGTDMVEVRGVLNSPLIGFDLATGCAPCDPSAGCAACVGATSLTAASVTRTAHVNDDSNNRPQFSRVDAYTAGASAANPMLVLVAFHDDLHPNCVRSAAERGYPLYPQSSWNVGRISVQTRLASGGSFGTVDFTDRVAKEFNSETPPEKGTDAVAMKNVRRAGILDDLLFFIDDSDPLHPALAQGIRRGSAFDLVTLADDIEDMQIAYGVDLDRNNAINRKSGSAASFDSNVSSEVDGDEWAPNVAGENPLIAADFRSDPDRCPLLHAVMISLVARSRDPDPTYRGPSARELVTLNSPIGFPGPGSGKPSAAYRRRIQTLRINLRNYAYEGS